MTTPVLRGMQRITLADRRAQAAELARLISEHRGGCGDCRPRQPCGDSVALRAELRAVQADIASWFAPNPDQGRLF
jgi:hypothetical protein